jgi:Beta-ketoacyl synthase, N-terminal domain
VITVNVAGIGLLGPGLADWASGQVTLRDPAGWLHAPTPLPAPMRLPAAERRRAGAIVRVSLAVADQACAQAGTDPARLATVFTASSGDAANCHALCESLATPERAVSPTRFTNSVHNAAAGYWHIATASRAPSTSLCAHDASFGAGLLEAAAQCVALARPVLLVAADVPYPEPLHGVRPLPDAFGVALLLTPALSSANGAAQLRLGLVEAAPSPCGHGGLDALTRQMPAARGLPLLQALARGAPSELVIDYLSPLGLAVELRT